MDCFADIYVSQGSVATYARCGEIVNIHLTANLPLNLPLKFFFKSVKIWQKYGHESVACLFWPILYMSACWARGWPLQNSKTDQDAFYGADLSAFMKPRIGWGHNSATWQIRLNDPCTSAMLPYVKLLWPLVTCTYQSYRVVMLLTFILIIIISSIPSPLTLSFQAQNLPFPQNVAFLFFFRTDSTDSSDCSPILLSISVWYL